jgi:hypothetical protein
LLLLLSSYHVVVVGDDDDDVVVIVVIDDDDDVVVIVVGLACSRSSLSPFKTEQNKTKKTDARLTNNRNVETETSIDFNPKFQRQMLFQQNQLLY